MSQISEPGRQPPEASGAAPLVEALTAGTLALMTAYAQSCCDGCRELIARRLVANLAELSNNAEAAPAFRMMVRSLQDAWALQLQALCAGAREQAPEAGAAPHAQAPVAQLARQLWHTAPETVQ